MFISTLKKFSRPGQHFKTRVNSLWTWGNADFGRSGVDHGFDTVGYQSREHFAPVEVNVLPQRLVHQIVCGGAHTLVVSASGRLLSCGLGAQGQLGRGLFEGHGEFLPVDVLDNVAWAGGGFWHSAAATKIGELYTWGSNKDNQLGLLGESGRVIEGSAFPLLVSALKGTKVIQVECGAYHTIALTSDKEVYTWGKGAQGRLGHGSESNEIIPRRVDALRGVKIASVAAGYDNSGAVSEDGRLWMWGHGGWNQLGVGSRENRLVPTLVPISANVKQVSCGGCHSAAVSHSGMLFSWGVGMYGALGLGDSSPDVVAEPAVVGEGGKLPGITQVACGWRHTLAATSTGEALAWGHGAEGRLGCGDDHDRWAPTRVPRLVGRSVRRVAAGFAHSAAF